MTGLSFGQVRPAQNCRCEEPAFHCHCEGEPKLRAEGVAVSDEAILRPGVKGLLSAAFPLILVP